MSNKKAISLELARALKESSLSDMIYIQNNKKVMLIIDFADSEIFNNIDEILNDLSYEYRTFSRDNKNITIKFFTFHVGYLLGVNSLKNMICICTENISTSNHYINYDLLYKNIREICDKYGVSYINNSIYKLTFDSLNNFLDYQEVPCQ